MPLTDYDRQLDDADTRARAAALLAGWKSSDEGTVEKVERRAYLAEFCAWHALEWSPFDPRNHEPIAPSTTSARCAQCGDAIILTFLGAKDGKDRWVHLAPAARQSGVSHAHRAVPREH